MNYKKGDKVEVKISRNNSSTLYGKGKIHDTETRKTGGRWYLVKDIKIDGLVRMKNNLKKI